MSLRPESETALRTRAALVIRGALAACMTVPDPQTAHSWSGALRRLEPAAAEYLRSAAAQRLAVHLREATAHLEYLAELEDQPGNAGVVTRLLRARLEKALAAAEEWEGRR